MRLYFIRKLVPVLGLAAGVFSACAPVAGAPTASLPVQPRGGITGSIAPDFRILAYQGASELGGPDVAFSQVAGRGKPVVLNFWAGLCPPCRAEMPDFEKVHQRYKGRVLLVGADIGPYIGLGSSQDGQALLKQLKITYPTGLAADRTVVQAYGILGMPTTVFIRGDGTIHKTRTGILNEAQMVSAVEELLKAGKTS